MLRNLLVRARAVNKVRLYTQYANETSMKDQTSHLVNLMDNSSQNTLLTRSPGATALGARGTRRVVPTLPPGGGDPTENEVDILITNPSDNATVSVPLSQGTFSVRGGVAVVGSAKFTNVEVKFGSLSKSASGKSSWTCTSPTITASGPLTITARALNGSVVVAEDPINVNIAITDDVSPVVAIT